MLAKAEERHRADLRKAREKALTGLRRSLARGGVPVAEQAVTMKEILRLDRSDEPARAFFQAVGSLDTVLAELGPDEVEIELLGQAPGGKRVLTLWNQHNGNNNDRGTLSVTVAFFLAGKEVARVADRPIPWQANADTSVDVPAPPRFDRVRIELPAIRRAGGGLSEVTLMAGGRNQLAGWRVTASSSHSAPFGPERLLDGITSSAIFAQGYWLMANGDAAGWVELAAP